ncbi:MAG: hypothetical protein Q7R35_18845 [Elusimicrobiota bacterium]|nr:hypothetical protein [Elusimicrobiota bacterium]
MRWYFGNSAAAAAAPAQNAVQVIVPQEFNDNVMPVNTAEPGAAQDLGNNLLQEPVAAATDSEALKLEREKLELEKAKLKLEQEKFEFEKQGAKKE